MWDRQVYSQHFSAAIKAYNTACVTGPIKFLLTDNNYSTLETFPIFILKTRMRVQRTHLTILSYTNKHSDQLYFRCSNINLWGAKYVTFDGRIGGIGSTPNLTIQNGLNTGNRHSVPQRCTERYY